MNLTPIITKHSSSLLFAALVLLQPAIQAGSIVWQSIPGQQDLTSEGTPFTGMTFEVGSFSDGFIPDSSNLSDWSTHWNVIDRTLYNQDNRFFASTVDFNHIDPTLLGSQAYIWGYKTGTNPEWILVTDEAWIWPTTSLTFPSSWNVATAGTVILGSVDPDGTPHFMQTAPVPSGLTNASISPAEWAASHFSAAQLVDPSISGLDADPDGDGLSNLMEMAGSTDPLAGETSDGSVAEWVEAQGFFYLKLTMTKAPIQGLVYRVETSPDLENWRSEAGSGSGVTIVEDSITTISARDNVPLSATNRRFIRLVVELID
ncbi:MAG: hypothetical protein AAF514_02105 [Verrucomicrobiota bacterium]